MAKYQVGFIGAGRMATALARGLVNSGNVPPAAIAASDPSGDMRTQFADAVPGSQVVESNTSVATESDLLVLAVKPQVMSSVLAGLAGSLGHRPLVVSIAAGVRLDKLADALPSGTRLVRVMPNTPALVGKGASAFTMGTGTTADDRQSVLALLQGVGWCCELPESSLDAVTGLSGSGPAFVYTVIEALTDGGVLCGLARDVASRLAVETVAGAAAMVVETGQHPATLRDAVTSPGGTTIAGMAALESHGLRAALIEAVKAATLRSRQLGN